MRGLKTIKIEMKKREDTTDSTEIERIIRDYYEQLHASKMDNLDEMTDSYIRFPQTEPGRNRKCEQMNHKH